MNEREFKITDARGGAAVGIRVVTKASATEIVRRNEDGTLQVRLMASPAGDPAANTELIDFIAGKLEIEKAKVEIVAGEGSRDKILSIEGLSTQQVEAKLLPQE